MSLLCVSEYIIIMVLCLSPSECEQLLSQISIVDTFDLTTFSPTLCLSLPVFASSLC
jgi:hypothetical protein